ncbi:hypothetical protein JB92DRAFT_3141867 [Gautieria morchelliformis]|nr:hypothetical protein JB92DRAFT_3141867 [Gautieria morchelliformis]
MHHNMFLVVPVLFLRVVAGTPTLRYVSNDRPDEAGPLPFSVSPSPVPSMAPVAPDYHTIHPSPKAVSDRALALAASVTTQVANYQTVTHAIASTLTNPKYSSTPDFPVPFATRLSSSTGLHTASLSSQQHNTQSSSPVAESINSIIGQPSVSSPPAAGTSTNSASKIRFAIIGVLAGVPVLAILGFFIISRRRRIRLARRPGMNEVPSDRGDLVFNSKERKGAGLSSFSRVSAGRASRVIPSKDGDGGNIDKPAYVSCIHSTAGLAGIGAHRVASANSATPMIRYISGAETSLDGELEKANFDNPFGTPPPVCAGLVTAPSRVSPHLPRTLPPQLINLPALPTATRGDYDYGQSGFAISHPVAIPSQNSTSRVQSYLQGGQPKKRWEAVKDPLPAHVRCRPLAPDSLGLLSPDMANHARTGTWNHKHFGRNDPQHGPHSDRRVSIAVSVYDGIASPGAFPTKNRSPAPIPMSSYLLNPRPEQTPVLPYLASPVARSELPNEPTQGVGPVIVIEAAPPALDSVSEYAETEAGDEARGLYMPDGSAHARRAGLSPQGFVAPSPTFSSISLYSIYRSGFANSSSSTSTAIPHESSASSVPAISSSSSGNSSVTIKDLMPNSIKETGMRNPDPEEGRHPNLSVAPWTKSRKDINKHDLEGLRGPGIAF